MSISQIKNSFVRKPVCIISLIFIIPLWCMLWVFLKFIPDMWNCFVKELRLCYLEDYVPLKNTIINGWKGED